MSKEKSMDWYCTTITDQNTEGLPEDSILFQAIKKRNNMDRWVDVIYTLYEVEGRKGAEFWTMLRLVTDCAAKEVEELVEIYSLNDFGTASQKEDWFQPMYDNIYEVMVNLKQLQSSLYVLLASNKIDAEITDVVSEYHFAIYDSAAVVRLRRSWVEENRPQFAKGGTYENDS